MKIQASEIGDFTSDTSPVSTPADLTPPGGCVSGHEWVVFSTALQDVCLMVQCVNCGTAGTVDDPNELEWAEAFHAPTDPYRWDEDERVTVRGVGPLYVLKAGEGQDEGATARRAEGTVV